jgi:hypothetical protein
MQATPASRSGALWQVAPRVFEGKFAPRDAADGRWMMLDAVFLALGLGFFAAGCLYLYACDRL